LEDLLREEFSEGYLEFGRIKCPRLNAQRLRLHQILSLTALLSRKLHTLIHGLTVFNPIGFIQALVLSRKFPINGLGGEFVGKTVICVGTGPSLDDVDLDQFHESIVLLLNSAIFRYKDFEGRGNTLFWYCVDRKRGNLLADKVPSDVRKIVSVHEFGWISPLFRSMQKRDIFILPSAVFRRVSGKGVPNIRPAMLAPTCKPLSGFGSLHRCLMPETVMLNAIGLSLGFKAKKIITLGFDLPASSAEYYYARDATPGQVGSGFNRSIVVSYLESLVQEAAKQNALLINHSPRSAVQSVLKHKEGDSTLPGPPADPRRGASAKTEL
jgi:hypothetical protein